jgi:hypothetical protein
MEIEKVVQSAPSSRVIERRVVLDGFVPETDTTWKTGFGNGRRSPLVMGNAPVTDQVLQISQER